MKLLIIPVLFLLIACSDTRLTREARIFDHAHLLTDAQQDSVFTLIKDLNEKTGSQIAVITIDTLPGKSINEYSLEVAENLGLGRKEQNDGILIAVAVRERQMRIEVGYGLEQIIKDEIAAKIIREIMAPRFREEKYGLGIYKAVDSIRFLIERDQALIGKTY